MTLDEYSFSRKFTWIQDRFAVSWQLSDFLTRPKSHKDFDFAWAQGNQEMT